MTAQQGNRRNDERSRSAFEEAKQYIPGGVNSPVRAFKSVGLTPIYAERGEGSKIYDIDGNVFIDYVGSWGLRKLETEGFDAIILATHNGELW